MTDALLLDTHIALWLESGDEQMRPETRQGIDACWRDGGLILMSAVTAWELALLVDKGHVALDLPVAGWIDRWRDRVGFELVPLSGSAASRCYSMPALQHRDPADHLLVATAIELGCPLVTYDQRITRFAEVAGRQYGFVVS